jgi:hypothetical protein
MGYAFGQNHRGEEIGYGIEAVCDEDGCTEEIDKGLAFCCGGMGGVKGEVGCGRYVCANHLFMGYRHPARPDEYVQLCGACSEAEDAKEEAGVAAEEG